MNEAAYHQDRIFATRIRNAICQCSAYKMMTESLRSTRQRPETFGGVRCARRPLTLCAIRPSKESRSQAYA